MNMAMRIFFTACISGIALGCFATATDKYNISKVFVIMATISAVIGIVSAFFIIWA